MGRQSVYRWDAAEKGSIAHPEALFELTECARVLFQDHPVIEIPKGILDHVALQLAQQFRSNLVESNAGGAKIHDHEWPVRLVSTPQTQTSTLIFTDAERVVCETQRLASESKFLEMDQMSLPFQRELQLRLYDCMHEVLWSKTDILIFGPGVLHARDVRTLDEREPGEDLMAFSMTFNPVS